MADITLNFDLHSSQLEVFNSPARFTSLAAGRRYGKSHLACVRAITRALSPENVRRLPVWIVAPVFPQAKQTYWRPLNEMVHPLIVGRNVNEGRIILDAGDGPVELGVKGADRPDSLRGVGLFDVVLDEYATMKPDVWEMIIRPALSDVRGTALFIGTPAGRNHFYELYKDACGRAEFPFRGAAPPNGEWQAFHYTSLDNPYLPDGEIEHARRTLSTAAFRQEYMASFETGGSDIMLLEWLKYEEEPVNPKGEKIPGEWYVLVDLAGFGQLPKQGLGKLSRLDQTAIAVVKILDDERWWVRDIILGRWGVEETARKIVDAIKSVETMNVGIEKGSLYNAVAPYLASEAAKRSIPLNVTPLSHENAAKTDRITWALQGQAEHGRLLLRPAPWNKDFEDQWSHFPSKMVHDDALDALAFITQMAKGRVFSAFAHVTAEPYWESLDEQAGF